MSLKYYLSILLWKYNNLQGHNGLSAMEYLGM